MKENTKYFPLYTYLRQSQLDEIALTFAQIETILQTPLPNAARIQRGWWSNRERGAVQAAAWMKAGYETEGIDLTAETATFRKRQRAYQVQRVGDTVVWDADLVKGLRQHMGLSQAEFADALGVRQQTISEWETGVYAPKRSTSKYLMLIAERAGFEYIVSPGSSD